MKKQLISSLSVLTIVATLFIVFLVTKSLLVLFFLFFLVSKSLLATLLMVFLVPKSSFAILLALLLVPKKKKRAISSAETASSYMGSASSADLTHFLTGEWRSDGCDQVIEFKESENLLVIENKNGSMNSLGRSQLFELVEYSSSYDSWELRPIQNEDVNFYLTPLSQHEIRLFFATIKPNIVGSSQPIRYFRVKEAAEVLTEE